MKILSTGSFVPPKILTNEEISKKTDISPEWILTRTGIEERRVVSGSLNSITLASEAARKAMKSCGVKPEEISFVLVATSSPDHLTPSVATSVQAELNLNSAFAFDISAGCSGFLYALKVAQSLLANGENQHGIIIGVEVLSRHINWEDHQTCGLFGDGAGAVVVRKKTNEEKGIFAVELFSDGTNQRFLKIGSDDCWTNSGGDFFIQMNGREVFKMAVESIYEATLHLLEKLKISRRDIRQFICHQANIRIIESVRRKLEMEKEFVPTNIDRFGNVGAASIPILLDELQSDGKLKRGDLLVLAAFGAGFTWASAALNW